MVLEMRQAGPSRRRCPGLNRAGLNWGA